MVTPAAKKPVVQHLIEEFSLSERVACQLAGLSRTAYRYQSRTKSDNGLRQRLKALATQYPRYGYLMLHGLLRGEGWVKNRKRTHRLYTEEGLQVRTKKRKKLTRPGQPMEVPTAPNQRWSMDFVSDQLSNGRRFRVLNVVDDYSREMVGQLVSVAISGRQVARFLDQQNIQDILNTLRAMRKHIIRSQLFINDDEILEVDSLRRVICMLHTKTTIARQANGRLKPVAAISPTV